MDPNNNVQPVQQPVQPQLVPQAPVAPMQGMQPQKKTNGFAIAGLICSLICCQPVGLILAIVGLIQSKKTNSGKVMSIISIVLAIIPIVFSLFYYLVLWPSIKDSIYDATICSYGENYVTSYYDSDEDGYIKCGSSYGGTYTCYYNTTNSFGNVVENETTCDSY